jgi:hypothetical protein
MPLHDGYDLRAACMPDYRLRLLMVRFDLLQKWAPRRRNAAIGGYETPSLTIKWPNREA